MIESSQVASTSVGTWTPLPSLICIVQPRDTSSFVRGWAANLSTRSFVAARIPVRSLAPTRITLKPFPKGLCSVRSTWPAGPGYFKSSSV